MIWLLVSIAIGKDLNNGFTTEETISTEDKLLNSIKYNYVEKNKVDNYSIKFSQWIKQK